MLSVFYSQPFHNRTEKEIFEERSKLEVILKARYGLDLYIIDQYHQEGQKIDILANDIRLMGFADVIIISEDWQEARGCQIEKFIADTYELPYLMFDPMSLTIY